MTSENGARGKEVGRIYGKGREGKETVVRRVMKYRLRLLGNR